MAPALMLLLRWPPRAAVATALMFSTLVKTGASACYLWQRQVDFSVLLRMLAGGIPGAILGAFLLQRWRDSRSDTWIMGIVGLFVVIASISNILHGTKRIHAPSSKPVSLTILAFPIGLETTFSSAGAGALGNVVLFRLTALNPAIIVGTDIVFGLVISGIGSAVHIFSGNYAWMVLAKLIPAGLTGTLAGSLTARILPSVVLRPVVLICSGFVGLVLIYQSFWR